MAKKILIVSFIKESIQYLEVEQRSAGYFPLQPVPETVTAHALKSACKRADDIYINSTFSAPHFSVARFPKASKRVLTTLIQQDAVENLHHAKPLAIEYTHISEISDKGFAENLIGYAAVGEDELHAVWNTFAGFHKKVRNITPLPVTLASSVVKSAAPEGNFMVLWVGEGISILSVNSSDGHVKMARSVPFGIPEPGLGFESSESRDFSRKIIKEISRTLSFYHQEFRDHAEQIFIVGSNHLEEAVMGDLSELNKYRVRFGLHGLPVNGMDDRSINHEIHLLGNLFHPPRLNFVPGSEVLDRKLGVLFNLSFAALVVMLAGALFVTSDIHPRGLTLLDTFGQKQEAFENLKKEVVTLRDEVNRMNVFEGCRQFYLDTYKKQPGWDRVLTEITRLLPENIVLNTLDIQPARQGRQGNTWNGQITGEVKAGSWHEGLQFFRAFGSILNGSPYFEIGGVNYSEKKPEELENIAKTFDFKISLKILPKEKSNEG